MTGPVFAPVDEETEDLLSLVADVDRVVGSTDVDAFLAACEKDAASNGGLVSVNRVRALLADRDMDSRRYSSFWCAFTGRGKPMVKTGDWETLTGSGPKGHNDGRPMPVRRWVGGAR